MYLPAHDSAICAKMNVSISNDNDLESRVSFRHLVSGRRSRFGSSPKSAISFFSNFAVLVCPILSIDEAVSPERGDVSVRLTVACAPAQVGKEAERLRSRATAMRPIFRKCSRLRNHTFSASLFPISEHPFFSSLVSFPSSRLFAFRILSSTSQLHFPPGSFSALLLFQSYGNITHFLAALPRREHPPTDG